MRGSSAVQAGRKELVAALEDPSPYVRIAAAEALAKHGAADDREQAWNLLVEMADWKKNDLFVAMQSLNAIGNAGPADDQRREQLKQLPKRGPVPDVRYAEYVGRLIDDL